MSYERILANGPMALALVMDAVVAATEDWRERTRAFLEERRLAFAGK
jgi:hypothetical protein